MGNVFLNFTICNVQQAEEKIRIQDLQHVSKLRTHFFLKSNYVDKNDIILDIVKPI